MIRAAVLHGLHQPWKIEEVQLGALHPDEVLVRAAYAGLCHSDEHLRTGDITAPPEALAMLGASSMFPIIGGHEGAGVVESVGDNVREVGVGDHVSVSFVPACGHCSWCASGRQHLCDLGAATLAGPMMSDGTWRHRVNGEPVNRMAQLGTFAEAFLVHHSSVVKVDPDLPLRAVALVSCGIATGFGSARNRAQVRAGEVVVVIGCGGVGSGAIQGARLSGARAIVAVDPVEFKREQAQKIGATHTAASMDEALALVGELTRGRMADAAIITVGVLGGDLLSPALNIVSKDGRLVVTSVAPAHQMDVKVSLFELAMYNKAILGSLFGSASPRTEIPRLMELYRTGDLLLDELVTREYTLDEINVGYDDLEAGRNIRGVLRF